MRPRHSVTIKVYAASRRNQHEFLQLWLLYVFHDHRWTRLTTVIRKIENKLSVTPSGPATPLALLDLLIWILHHSRSRVYRVSADLDPLYLWRIGGQLVAPQTTFHQSTTMRGDSDGYTEPGGVDNDKPMR